MVRANVSLNAWEVMFYETVREPLIAERVIAIWCAEKKAVPLIQSWSVIIESLIIINKNAKSNKN